MSQQFHYPNIYSKESKAGSSRNICTPTFTAALFKIAKGWKQLKCLMDKQNMLYTYNRISFSPKKEGNSDTYYNMDEPWVTKGQSITCWFDLYEAIRMVKFIKT